MKKLIDVITVLALLVSLSACAGTTAEARKGSGVRNTGSTVSQILEEATRTETPPETAVPTTPEAPAHPAETAPPQMDPSEQAAPSSASAPETAAEESGIDIDLTLLNSTMLYSEVYSMMVEPEAFLGKTVRLAGYCTSSYYEPTDMTYYAVIIPDATACCAQGIEYTLADGAAYPADDTDIVITGTFELYEELGVEYCRLGNAKVET